LCEPMSFDFQQVLRKREVITNVPIKRFGLKSSFPFFGFKESNIDIYYPELTLTDVTKVLRDYLSKPITKESIDKKFKLSIAMELRKLYQAEGENKDLKLVDLMRLDKIDLVIMLMDTVHPFIKKKKMQAEGKEEEDYRIQRYWECVWQGEALPSTKLAS